MFVCGFLRVVAGTYGDQKTVSGPLEAGTISSFEPLDMSARNQTWVFHKGSKSS